MHPDSHMSTKDIASAIGKSETHVGRMVAAGRLPAPSTRSRGIRKAPHRPKHLWQVRALLTALDE